jgi:hypothetical protein
MADRVPFLVRLDPEVMAALKRWANDDLRSLNAEIEFLLRRSLVQARRLPSGSGGRADTGGEAGATEAAAEDAAPPGAD